MLVGELEVLDGDRKLTVSAGSFVYIPRGDDREQNREEKERTILMGRQVRQAVPHLSLEEVKQRMKREPRFWVRQRWWIIYHAQIAPGNTREIAKQTGVSERTVRRVISSYNRLGPATMETPGTGGRRHEYLTAEQEQVFLAPFFARAKHGELTTVRHIRQALEAEVNHAIGLSTVYDLLHRHGWRKLVPRPLHPKANPEEQAAFLKNFPAIVQASVATRDPSDQRPVLLMAQDEGRFGCISVPRRAWAPPGVRPRSARQVVREYIYVYTAVAPAHGKNDLADLANGG